MEFKMPNELDISYRDTNYLQVMIDGIIYQQYFIDAVEKSASLPVERGTHRISLNWHSEHADTRFNSVSIYLFVICCCIHST